MESEIPLTYQEIWEIGVERRLNEQLSTKGKTPEETLGARLYAVIKDQSESDCDFIKVGSNPVRFFLRSRKSKLPNNILEIIEKSEQKKAKKKDKNQKYKERDLHPLVSYFAYANPTFSKGRGIFTKTIFHEKASKRGYSEWTYPDLVGFQLPLDDWSSEIIKFNRMTDNNALKLFSFELKKALDKANYRESFFQAVSNSSWANEGYLIVAEIKQDDALLSELKRLSISFGVGIIQLDLDDIDSSKILYPARTKNQLDWETMNKLSGQNDDFKQFLADVKIAFDEQRIFESMHDKIIDDPTQYIEEKITGKKS